MTSVINDKLQHQSPENDYNIREINLLSTLIKAASRVLSQEITEIESDPVLSDIEYKSPKAANQPIDYAYGRKDLEGLDKKGFPRRFGYSFRRSVSNSPWTKARVGMSSGTVSSTLNLTKDFFLAELKLAFDKAEFVNDPNGVPEKSNIFYFHSADSGLKYAFHARSDNSNIEDGYPKNFFEVKISRP